MERRHFRETFHFQVQGVVRSDPELRGAILIFLALQVAKIARDRESERGTKIVLGCKGLSSSISTWKMNSALYTGVEIVRRIVCLRDIKDPFVRMSEFECEERTGQ